MGDGDILTLQFNNKIVFIFREDELNKKANKNGYYVCHTAENTISVHKKGSLFFCGYTKDARLATEEEKQFLFNKMKKQGLKWNAKEKKVETIRWRAKNGEKYYYLNVDFSVSCSTATSKNKGFDDMHYNSFCQFRTEKDAKEAAKRIKETLLKYHDEIKE